MDIKEKFGLKIKQIRLGKSISQEKLANLANLDRTYIQSIESGKRNVSIIVLEKLSKALNVPIGDFFQEDNDALSTD
jgi:transcriptional regulator with XRE-family HTH domain